MFRGKECCSVSLTLFNHERRSIAIETNSSSSSDKHKFGGSLSDHAIKIRDISNPCHVVFVLDTTDDLVPISVDGVQRFPLIHGFQFCSNGEEFIYRVLNEREIEVISHTDDDFKESFPYDDYPEHFPELQFALRSQPHDETKAEDALLNQGVFGLDALSDSETQRAVEIAKSTWHPEKFERSEHSQEYTDTDLMHQNGCEPFCQTIPSDRCPNPQCTAEVDYVMEAYELDLPDGPMQIPEAIMRIPTLQVVAIHEGARDEELWGGVEVQLIFQLCGECGCVVVSNQCT